MEKNSPLFTLIKKLTMSEKRYFSIFSKRHSIGANNKYLSIYNFFNATETENTQQAKEILEQQGINFDFFAADKNHLYNLILQSLNQFHHNKSGSIVVRNNLIIIEILFYKGLFKQALSRVNITKKMAVAIENFSLLIEILFWEKKCLGYSKGLLMASNINKEISATLKKLNNLQTIIELYYESYQLHISMDKYAITTTRSKFKKLLNHPLLQKPSNAISNSAKIYYQLIYAHSHYAENDVRKELACLNKIEKILLDFPEYKTENPLDYISIYNRILGLKKHIDAKSFLDELQQITKWALTTEYQKSVIFLRLFVIAKINELEYQLLYHSHIDMKETEKIIKLEIADQGIEVEPYYLINLYYLCAQAHFKNKYYEHSLKTVNFILNEFNQNERPPIFAKLEILNLQLHYALKNNSLMPSLTRKIIRIDAKNGILSKIEKELVSIFNNFKGNFTTRQKELLKQMLEESKITYQANKYTKSYLYDNYSGWLEELVNEIEKPG